ncbi:MAG: hypothetical protein HQ481_08610 [Alphaproteobacteria bacterium]|nr:hypothetical protein [Alphaproteobacteria bacterium]
MNHALAAATAYGLPFDTATARAVVDDAITRYIASRRDRIDGFVDIHFGVKGALDLHRHALGADLIRAPVNLALMPPQLLLQLAGIVVRRAGARRAGHWMASRRLLLRTSVDRELEWRLWTELLELPYADGGRIATADALAEAMMSDPRLHPFLAEPLAEIARHADDPDIRRRVEETVATYTGTRAAAADMVGALVNAGVGYLAAQQITPSVWTLGPVLAAAVAHQAAVISFPFGAAAGGLWYGWFPATANAALIGGTTVGLAAAGAVAAAFAGVLADPVQKAFGMHRRRLNRMLDVMERNFRGDGPLAFAPKDHYVARLIDVIDMVRAAHRAVQGA